jgi:hypothetical protein
VALVLVQLERLQANNLLFVWVVLEIRREM